MTKKKDKTVTMSVPEGLEFDTSYTMNSTHNKFYWDVDRNKDPWKYSNPKFGWHLDKVVEKITKLLKEKNEAYGNTALNPSNIFSKCSFNKGFLKKNHPSAENVLLGTSSIHVLNFSV